MKLATYRIAAGVDGVTTVESVEFEMVDVPIGTGLHAHAFEGEYTVALACFPAGFFRDMHNSDAPSWAQFVSGRFEVLLGGGRSHTFGPGDLALFDDLTGDGHGVRIPYEDAWVFTAGSNPRHDYRGDAAPRKS